MGRGRTTVVAAFLLLAACTGVIGDAAPGVDAAAPVASAATASSVPIRRLRRLSNREYNNVVRDLLGDTTQPANLFIPDSYSNGYDNGSAGLAVQSDQVASYQAAGEALAAAAVSNNMNLLLGGCDVTRQGQAACLESMLATFAPRAYRRPLTTTEAARLRDAFQVGAQTTGGFDAGVQTVLEVILQSPQFLYREELGPPVTVSGSVPAAGTDVRMTDYEVASELSFLLTGSIPDAPLWSAVQRGQFHQLADYRREATRLLATPGARDAMRAFLHEWMATDRLVSLTKDATFYPSFSPAMAASMHAELDAFFDDILWSGSGSLQELFTSNRSFADPTLATLYGVKAVGSGLQPVTLDPVLRRGILSRAGYLAVHSDVDSSGPIARGVFALQSILCTPPPPPPANVPPATPANDPTVQKLTTRQRFGEHVASSFCATCHTAIDGVGFGFEEFDGIGAYRTSENGLPVDSSGTILGTGEIDGPYKGVSELAPKVAASRHLAGCYLRQAYRYAMGDIEPAGGGVLDALEASFSPDTRITDALLSMVSTSMFVTRVSETPSP
ncbi:MAG TPA: DUF1592 domain-containing protein [Polyangiaceae bacterium]|jgi:hypothetical protein|nr:DUF1592 domain-containing protein [Polyangiaceae bacterium]